MNQKPTLSQNTQRVKIKPPLQLKVIPGNYISDICDADDVPIYGDRIVEEYNALAAANEELEAENEKLKEKCNYLDIELSKEVVKCIELTSANEKLAARVEELDYEKRQIHTRCLLEFQEATKDIREEKRKLAARVAELEGDQ